MAGRSISISPRKEDIREKHQVQTQAAVQFPLEEIRRHFLDSLFDIQRQIDVADELAVAGKLDEARDIWRAQVVYAEGIMDFYLHELSKYALVKMFLGEWEKSKTYDAFQIPMCTVEVGLKHPESTEWLFDRLNTRFGLEVYLSPDSISKQLTLIGMKLDDICKAAFPKEEGNDYVKGQDRLKALYARRNQIAHQADRRHSTAEKEDIDQEFVQEALDTVKRFVDTVHQCAVEKQRELK